MPLQPLTVGAVLTGRALIADLSTVPRMKGEYRLNGRIMLRSHPLVNVVLQVALMIAQDLRQGGHWVTQLTCSWSTRALIKALFSLASWGIRV
ncbi:hypothetical protein A8B84_18505 [Marinobacter sp. EhC06]|nr:hypothetical protein A8B80_20510 [Marinobacter sp. EhN04]OAN95415.1 hypothetical protein A8B84_18505 [Marinobacter sp. EhC06]